ncbi:tandem-95 repeat protein, partial [Microvirga aerilata]|nr:tandem-95 repeat protein [Microvirga aerilata]
AGTAEGQEDGGPITGTVTATDKDGDKLTYAIDGDKPAGLTFNADGSYSYTPAKDFAGEVTFQFVAYDGKVNSAPQTVTLTVVDVPEAPVNVAPVAEAGTAEGQEDGGPITGTVTATDKDGDKLTYSLVQGPTAEQGTLTFNKDGSYSFTPAANFAGPVEFTYKATDGTADSNDTTVTITVAAMAEPALPEINLTSGPAEVIEGGEATYTFTRTGDTSTALEINVNVTGTAIGQDHNGAAGKVTFAPNSATATYSIKIMDDDTAEAAETIVVGMAQGDGYMVGTPFEVTTNIIDNDEEAPPAGITVTPSNGDTVVAEGGATDTVSIVLNSKPTATVYVFGYGDEQIDTGGRVLEFTPENWDVPQDFVIGAHDDAGTEDSYTGNITFTTDSDDLAYLIAPPTLVPVTVNDNDAPSTSGAPVVMKPEAPTSVDEDTVETDGIAIYPLGTDPNSDSLTYELYGDQPEKGTVTWNPTDGNMYFKAHSGAFQHLEDGQDETVTFQYVANDGTVDSAPAQMSVLVRGVSDAPTRTLSVSDVTVSEALPESGAPRYALVTITLSEPAPHDVRVNYKTTDGAGVAGEDYTAQSGVALVPYGQTEYAISIPISQDTAVEPNEVFKVVLSNPVNAIILDSEASVTITDDDEQLPVDSPVVNIGDAEASEAKGEITFAITLSAPAVQDVTLTYEATASGKVIGFDGTGAIHSAIPAGYEGLRWTGVSSSGDGAALTATTGGGQIQAITPGELSLTGMTVSTASTNQVITIEAIRGGVVVGSQQVTLGNGGPQTATVALGPNFSAVDAVRIDGSADSYGNDYPIKIDNVVLGGGIITDTVTIPAASSSGVITVPVTNDSAYEVGETISVRLTGATGATLGTEVEATGTIINDDAEPVGENAPLPVVTILANTQLYGDVREGQGGVQEFEITRDARLDQELTVNFESDTFGPFTATFRPDESKTWATVAIPEDNKVNPSTYEIKLAASENYLPGAVTGVSGRFIDNDGAPVNTAPKAWASDTGTSESMFAQYGGYYSLGAYGQDAETPNVELTYTLVSQQPEFGTISQDPDYGGLRFKPTQEFLDSIYKGKDATFSYDFTVSDGQYTTDVKTATFTVYGEGNPAGFVPEISITGPTEVTEGGMASYVFTRTGASNSELRVPVTVTGTADGTDYTAYQTTAYFGWNSSTAVININATDDKAVETTETLVVTAGSGSGHTVSPTAGSVTTNLLDNDTVTTPPPVGTPGSPPKTPGLTVTPSGTGTVVAEDGKLTDTFTVVLNTAPASDVNVYIDSSTYEATVIPGYLTFGPTNWHMPQTVTVKAYAEGEPGGTDSLMIYGWSDEDPDYGWVSAPDLPVTVLETAPAVVEPPVEEPPVEEPPPVDEPPAEEPPPVAATPGITVTPSGTGTSVTEDGTTDTFTVVLNTQPISDVTVDIFPSNEQVTLSRYSFTFTPEDWYKPQTVTVAGYADGLDEPGGNADSLMILVSSDDPNYLISVPDLAVTVTDTAPVVVPPPVEEPPPVDEPPVEEPLGTVLTIANPTGLNEKSTISWNGIARAASYELIGVEPDEPNFPAHTLGFTVAPKTSYAIDGSDEFVGMVVHVVAKDATGAEIARSDLTEVIANINDDPTGRPVLSDNTPDVGQLLTISMGDLEDGDGMRADRPDEFGYIIERSKDGGPWEVVSTTDSYAVTAADSGYAFRGAAVYLDRAETQETVYSLTTAPVNDPNPNTPPVAFDDTATGLMGSSITIDVRKNDFDFESDETTIDAHTQGRNGTVTVVDGQLVYTPNTGFVGIDTFDYTLNGGDTARVTVTVTQPVAEPFMIKTVDNLTENSTLSWTAVPGAVSYVFIGTEPDAPGVDPHELGYALAPNTSYVLAGNDEFAGMVLEIEARDALGNVIARSQNQTGVIENINDDPTGNLAFDDMTPEVGQILTLGYGTFNDDDGYRDRGRAEEFEWAVERSRDDGKTWETVTTGVSPEDGPFGFSYTVTQADYGYLLRGRAIYEDRAGDNVETVYSLNTGRVGVAGSGGGEEPSGEEPGGEPGTDVPNPGSVAIDAGTGVTATELGANGSFTLVLNDAPTAPVTITVSGDEQVYAQGPDGSSQVVFDDTNWFIPQTVTVVASEDGSLENAHSGNLFFMSESADPRYNMLMMDEVLPVAITDAPRERVMPTVTVDNLGEPTVTEGGTVTFTFHRSEADGDLPIDYALTGVDLADIASIQWNGADGGVPGFRGLSQWATLAITLADNDTVDPDRALTLTLKENGYIFDVPFVASATVLDNDGTGDTAGTEPLPVVTPPPVVEPPPAPLPVINATTGTGEVTEGGIASFVLTRTGDTAQPLTVTVDLDVGTAKSGSDFTGPTTVTFAAGLATATLDLQTINDGVVEQPETIEFRISAGMGYTVGAADGNVTDLMDVPVVAPPPPLTDPEPAQFADPYNYDQGNGGVAGRPTAGNDIFNDGAGLASTIQGLGGNDTIYGKDGNDINLVGGTGSDTIYGGTGNDQITGDGGPTDTTTTAGANNVGAPGADSLYGGDGNDTINGQDGNDILVGSHGADDLTGGLGDDTFVFNDIFDRGDTVRMQGQGAANDVFDFRNFDFDPNTVGTQGAANGLQLFNQAPVEGQMLEDTFYYNSATGRLSLNTGTDGLEDFHVTLLIGGTTPTPLPRLNADDILI